jgi:hypothetical protein
MSQRGTAANPIQLDSRYLRPVPAASDQPKVETNANTSPASSPRAPLGTPARPITPDLAQIGLTPVAAAPTKRAPAPKAETVQRAAPTGAAGDPLTIADSQIIESRSDRRERLADERARDGVRSRVLIVVEDAMDDQLAAALESLIKAHRRRQRADGHVTYGTSPFGATPFGATPKA